MSIESPCIRLCILDAASSLCSGCGRSGDEIAVWIQLSPERRREIMGALPARLEGLKAAPAMGGV